MEWSHKDRRALRRMYESGVDITLIAIELGRTLSSVENKISLMALRRPKPSLDDVDRVPLSDDEVTIWDRQIRADNARKVHGLSLSELAIWRKQEGRERA